MALKNYRELAVWQRAMDLTVGVYALTEQFPRKEQFGLAGQTQRAAVSVSADIAEGYGRDHRGDYLHHLSIASGSLCELETHLILAGKLGYITRDAVRPAWDLCQQVGKMLGQMRRTLK